MLAEGTEGNQTIKWTVDPGCGQGSETRGPSCVPCTRVFPLSPKKKKETQFSTAKRSEGENCSGRAASVRFEDK